jgi:hypothetical protein
MPLGVGSTALFRYGYLEHGPERRSKQLLTLWIERDMRKLDAAHRYVCHLDNMSRVMGIIENASVRQKRP